MYINGINVFTNDFAVDRGRVVVLEDRTCFLHSYDATKLVLESGGDYLAAFRNFGVIDSVIDACIEEGLKRINTNN